MAYKVFTNGSTLQASEVNDNLMNQAVATFSNAAARTAAITSPVEGQLTYLEDTNQYASWDGSAWVSPFGLTLIKTQTVGSGVSTVTVSDVFSGDYNNYLILISGINSTNDDNDMKLKLNNSVGSTYNFAGRIYNYAGTSVASQAASSSGGMTFSFTSSQSSTSARCEIYNPFLAVNTVMTSQGSGQNYGSVFSGQDKNAVSHTGFNFYPSGGTISGGIIYVYGYRKA